VKIYGLQKTTLIDYPGEIACIVFLKGCNLRCPFCYSKELVLDEDDDLEIRQDEFFDFLKKRKGQLDACVICGGEPTINPEIFDFCLKIKKLGYKIKLDTNGTNPVVLKKLIDEGLIDYIAMDVKAPFSKYKKVTNSKLNVENIKKSIDLIKNSKIDYEFRTTVVPEIHTLNDIKKIVKEVAPAKKYFIQSFRNDKELLNPKFNDLVPFDEFEVQKIINEIKQHFEICYLR